MKLLAVLSMVLVTVIGWSSAQAEDQYGSIAFSQEANGGYNYGISWNHATRDAARSRAVQECRNKGGRNCGEVLAFRNTCGAVAIGGGNGYGTGGGDSVDAAEQSAISKCRVQRQLPHRSVALLEASAGRENRTQMHGGGRGPRVLGRALGVRSVLAGTR